MKNAMLKNAFAEMKKTKSRFLSIFGIIAIGTGFLRDFCRALLR